MGFFDKVKSALNVGGASVKIKSLDAFDAQANAIKGVCTITSKGEKTIKALEVDLQETRTEPAQDAEGMPSTQYTSLGLTSIPCNFIIKEGEEKEISFELKVEKSRALNPMLKTLLGLSFSAEDPSITYEYQLKCSLVVDGAMIMPSDSATINF